MQHLGYFYPWQLVQYVDTVSPPLISRLLISVVSIVWEGRCRKQITRVLVCVAPCGISRRHQISIMPNSGIIYRGVIPTVLFSPEVPPASENNGNAPSTDSYLPWYHIRIHSNIPNEQERFSSVAGADKLLWWGGKYAWGPPRGGS